jgi:hypothetical protein
VNNFELKIDLQRLLLQIAQLADGGRDPNGGTTRLALSSADQEGRDRVVGWMRETDLAVTIDPVGPQDSLYAARKHFVIGVKIHSGPGSNTAGNTVG